MGTRPGNPLKTLARPNSRKLARNAARRLGPSLGEPARPTPGNLSATNPLNLSQKRLKLWGGRAPANSRKMAENAKKILSG